jgi:hypothetical protein
MLCKILGFHGSDYEEWRLLGYKNPVHTSQESHYFSAIKSSQLMPCKIWGFQGGDYEECRLLGYKTLVHTSQETHYFSAIEPSLLMLYKIWGLHCRLWRMPSSGMLRRVALVRTDVSMELSASVFRVTRIGELGTTVGVASNRRTLRRNRRATRRNIAEDAIPKDLGHLLRRVEEPNLLHFAPFSVACSETTYHLI